MELGRFELGLKVRDLKRSLDFYQKLGFELVDGGADYAGATLQKGDCRLVLSEGHGQPSVLNFLDGDLPAIAKALARQGLHFERDSAANENGASGTLHDPDGNTLCFIERAGDRPRLDAAAVNYSGEAGRRYHERRKDQASDEVQRYRASLFDGLSGPDDTLLDFGCGTGGVAAALPAKYRIGIEIAEAAALVARQKLDMVVSSLSLIPTGRVDVAISFHAIEHIQDPSAAFQELFRVLRPGGRMKVFVPCEMPILNRTYGKWSSTDPDLHLFSWTPQTLGNLLHTLGFVVDDAKVVPQSSGGWLGMIFPKANWPRVFKAMRTGKFQVELTVTRPPKAAEAAEKTRPRPGPSLSVAATL